MSREVMATSRQFLVDRHSLLMAKLGNKRDKGEGGDTQAVCWEKDCVKDSSGTPYDTAVLREMARRQAKEKQNSFVRSGSGCRSQNWSTTRKCRSSLSGAFGRGLQASERTDGARATQQRTDKVAEHGLAHPSLANVLFW